MDAVKIADALGDVPLFGPLPAADRVELATRMHVRRFQRDEVVFHRDDPATHLYLIVAGTVKVTLPDETGREAVVALERGGEMFGELALFDGGNRSATVTAVTETVTMLLERDDLLRILERNPRVMRHLLAVLAGTIRRLSGRVEDLVFLDVPSRVAKCLLDLTEIHGGATREISLTQDDLAAFVGATRVSVNRVLADLESRGLIVVTRRHISIVDPDRLAKEIQH